MLSWGTECTAGSDRVRLAAARVAAVAAAAGAGSVFVAAVAAADSNVAAAVFGAVVVQPPSPRPNCSVLMPRLVTARPRWHDLDV